MEEEIEDTIKEEVWKRVEELKEYIRIGNYKRANKILEMVLYCIKERDNTEVMIS